MKNWAVLGQAKLQQLGPVTVAGLLSLVFSLIAISASVTPNNDGMMYVEAAALYQQGGLKAVIPLFNWPFLPAIMGQVSSWTGLHPQTVGYALMVCFLASTCALLVACTREIFPEAGWAACAIVLLYPPLNNYREHILREFGGWCFIFLAFWLVLRWARTQNWRLAAYAQVSLVVAALFRPESLAFMLAFLLWLLSGLSGRRSWRQVILMAAGPLIAGSFLAAAWVWGGMQDRILTQLAAINPVSKSQEFGLLAQRFADAVLVEWSRDEARSILFWGLISVIPAKFIGNLGMSLIPLVYAFRERSLGTLWQRMGPLAWAIVIYLLTLSAFVIDRLFLTARYVGLLNLFFVPLIALGLWAIWERFPRWRRLVGLLVIVLAVGGVISTKPAKTRFIPAAAWVSEQGMTSEKVFSEAPEVTHLLGWGVKRFVRAQYRGHEAAAQAVSNGTFDLGLLEGSAKNTELEQWLEQRQLQVVAKFSDKTGRALVAFRRADETKTR